MLFFIIMVIVIYMAADWAWQVEQKSRQAQSQDKVIKVVREKFCPPHKWKWVDMVDQNGEKVGEKLICQICGPLQSQSGRD